MNPTERNRILLAACALLCACPGWAVLVTAENDEASKALGASIAPLCFGAGFDAEGIRYRGGSGVLVFQDVVNDKSYIVTSAHAAISNNTGQTFHILRYGFGPNYYEGFASGHVLTADLVIYHPTRDVALVRLDGLATEEDGSLIEPIEFYDADFYGELAVGMIILFAGTGENGDPSLGGPSGSGVRDGYARAARGELHRYPSDEDFDPGIWFMKYFPSLTVGGIGASGDSGGPATVEREGKSLLCGINDMVRGVGTATRTGFEYFGYRGPDGTDQTIYDWITKTIADNSSEEGEGDDDQPLHAADINADGIFSLSELLRVIQFYNSGGHHCAAVDEVTEDSYAPGVDALAQACAPHSSDYNPADWSLSLSELLRSVQLYNTGTYHPCPEGEDGYCPGAAPAGTTPAR